MVNKGIVGNIAEAILGSEKTDVDELTSIGANVALAALPDNLYNVAIEAIRLLGLAFTKLAELGADKKLTVEEIEEVKGILGDSKLLKTIFTTVLRKLVRG